MRILAIASARAGALMLRSLAVACALAAFWAVAAALMSLGLGVR